jgi:signal transduction histidine kinase
MFDAAAEDKGGRLAAAGDERVLVNGDRDLLFDAMANLVDNAIKHGRQAGRVTVEVRESNGGAVISSPMTGREFPPTSVSTCSSASTGWNEVAAPLAMGWAQPRGCRCSPAWGAY